MNINNSGHATIIIERDGIKICVDPFVLPQEKIEADYILITHSHFDHFDPEKISKITKPETIIIHHNCAIEGVNLEIGDKKVFNKISVEAVQAYNTNKKFHPKGFGAGYIIEFEGRRIYHAGDTDLIPEMNQLKNIDLACLPIAGTYTMNEEEAARAVEAIKPKAVMPIHYDSVIKGDPQKFKSLIKNSQTKLFIREAII